MEKDMRDEEPVMDADDSDNESTSSSASETDNSEIVSDDDEFNDDYDEEYDDKRAKTQTEKLFAKTGKEPEPEGFQMGDYGGDDDDEDDEDEDEYDENYLQKFDENLKQNIISDYHPEMQQLNYAEVELLTIVKRDDDGEIYDPLHRTLPFLTKFEKARVLGERAKQINDGAKPFVKLTTNAIDGYLIALAELEQKLIPFIIKRPLPNGGCEYWKLKDLDVLI
jgi:DNA-directed RNA polymerase I, II, and III subunit RPABC2